MRRTLNILAVILVVSITGCSNSPEPNQTSRSSITNLINRPSVNEEKTRLKAKEALSFSRSNNFNTDFCVLIDMSTHSGIKRFFLWDFKNDTVSSSFLVSHGCCDNPWNSDRSKEKAGFSNVNGSHCTALGKYRIGERGYSNWGINIKYLLYGLEPTNDNAIFRVIVLHSWENVADEEIYPHGTPEGWGCPTISNTSMKILDPKLKNSQKPVLMWIYN